MAINISKQISQIKSKIITAIENDPDIIKAIDNPDIVDPQDLEYKNIFPSWRIPDVEVDSRTCICVSVSSAFSKKSEVVKKFIVEIMIFTTQTLQRVPNDSVARGCTRVDYISERIEDILSRNTELGIGETHLVSSDEKAVDARHPARILTFEVFGFNSNYAL